MSEHDDVKTKCYNGVLQIRINRPHKLNALTTDMYNIIRYAIESAVDDKEIHAVLLYGSTLAFTAGNDLDDFNQRDFEGPSPASKLLNTLHLFEKPVVAAVSGIAVGIGATILLHCDLVYASETRFRMPFVNLGVCPEAGSSFLLPMLAGHRKASEILMLGEFFDTKVAIDIGLVTAELPTEEVLNYAISKAEQLVSLPAQSLMITKRLMKKTQKALLIEHMKEEFDYFGKLLASPESKKIRNLATK